MHLIDEQTPEFTSSLTKPDADQTIRLTLHFGELQPQFYLDALVPRICENAIGAPDRRTKIAACELTHSIVLYVIGTRNYGAGSVWRMLCTTMLQLGADGDVAVKQMFEPLLMQLMHYMSQRSQMQNPGVSLMFDCLMDGVSHANLADVRDMSARCLREYVEWSARQNNEPMEILSSLLEILQRLKLYSFDSSSHRRIGAAVAFNHLYRILRENDFLIDVAWLDILYTFAVNFLMSEQTGLFQTDLSHSGAALKNVSRVLQERASMLNTANEDRKVPPAFNGNNLRAAVEWLFSQISTPLLQYRRKCISLVQQLAPCVDRCGSVKAFLHATQTTDTILTVCERPVVIESDLQCLLVSLDCYAWLLPDNLVPNSIEILSRSHVIRSISAFLNTTILTIVTDQQVKAHAECLNAVVDFIVRILPNCSQPFAQFGFWDSTGNALISVILQLIFAPHEFCIEMPSSRAKDLISSHQKLCPADFSTVFKSRISAELQSRYEEIVETAEMYLHSTLVPVVLLNSARGILLLLQCGQEFEPGTKLLNDLFEGLCEQRIGEDFAHSLLPDVKRYGRLLMRISLHFKPTRQLIDLIFNEKPLKQSDIQSSILHGRHFLQVFQKTIMEYLLESPEAAIADLNSRVTVENILFAGDVFRDLLQYAYKTNAHNRIMLKEIVVGMAAVFTKMFAIHNASKDKMSSAISYAIVDLVTNVALICPDPLITLSNRINGLEQFLIEILSDQLICLELKSRAIFLIPCLIDSASKHHDQLEEALIALQGHHFPLLSSEFPNGSIERSEFAGLFQSILDALVASKSPIALRFIMQTTSSEPKHILEFEIAEALKKYVTTSLPENKAILQIPYEMFVNQSLEPSIRLQIIKRFVLPMMRASAIESVFGFFADHLNAILDMTSSNYGISASGWLVEHALVNRIGAYQMLETMVGIIPVERLQLDPLLLRSMSSPPKSLIGLLTAKTMATRGEIFVTEDPVASELFRIYQCATYATICSVVCNTQKDIVYYEKLLFKENSTKNELIWQKIIDCRITTSYSQNLSQEFEELPRRKERLVSIRGIGAGDSCAHQTDRLFVQSQNVFDSSLSQDVTKIDLSTSTVRTEGEVSARRDSVRNVIELERVPINDHEVMATLCAVIKSMFEKEITPIIMDSEKCRPAPLWAKHLFRVLEDSAQPRNVRYFVAKLIDNCRAYFKNYAGTVTGPLLAFLADECAVQTEGPSINFFLVDLTVTLLEWSDAYTLKSTEEIQSARILFKYLMVNAYDERKDVFKQRLEVIRSLVQIWRELVPLPRQELFDSISRTTRPDARDNLCGIQLNAIVLCSNLSPWTDSTREQFFRAVLVSLDNEFAAVYQPASYLMGMLLNRMVPADRIKTDPLVEVIRNKLEKLRTNRSSEKRFTDILYGLHKNFPSIASDFMVTIANFVVTSSGAVKRIYLEIFLASMDVYGDEIFRELSALGLNELLRSEEYQLMALHCINKALPKLNVAHLNSVTQELSSLVQSKQIECRRIVFEIFIYILTHIEDLNLRNISVSTLLIGLTDSEPTIKTRLFHFWTNCKQLPATVDGRMLGLLNILYDPRVEDQFLAYGTQLLLDPAIQSIDAKRPVFPHQPPEEDVKLVEYDIDVSWSGRNSSLRAPLFMHSQQQSLKDASQLKATQNTMVFEPTQDPSYLNVETANDKFSSLNSQTSLLFSVAPQMLDRRSQRVGPSDGANQQAFQTVFGKLRERFIREKSGATIVNRKWVDYARSKELKKKTIVSTLSQTINVTK